MKTLPAFYQLFQLSANKELFSPFLSFKSFLVTFLICIFKCLALCQGHPLKPRIKFFPGVEYASSLRRHLTGFPLLPLDRELLFHAPFEMVLNSDIDHGVAERSRCRVKPSHARAHLVGCLTAEDCGFPRQRKTPG